MIEANKILKLLLLVLVATTFVSSNENLNHLQFLSDSGDTTLPGIKCFWLEPNSLAVFDLKHLKRPVRQKFDYNFTKGNDTVLFNFCDNIIPQCNDSPTQVSAFENENMANCKRLSGQQKSVNNWTLLNETDPTGGFEILLNSGEVCQQNPVEYYSTSYIMKCNSYMKEEAYNLTETSRANFNKNNCRNVLEFETKEACPKFNFYAIWFFLQKYKILFGAILILIGLFEILLGAKLMIVTIFITSCIATVTVVFIFLFQFVIPNGAHQAIVWVVLGISSVCGLGLGYLITIYNKFLIGTVLGGYMGYILGLLLYNVALNHIEASPVLIFWVTIIVSILICSLIAYYLVTFILIISTSFCGAYAFIRGISLYAGGFPNESYIMDLIKNEEYETLHTIVTPAVYGYLCGWVFLFIIGVIVQIKTKSEEGEEKQERDENADYYLRKK